MRRLKVLISAYACRPGMGSEPGVGWNVARELAKYHDVWLLTRSDNYPRIEAEISQVPIEGLQIIAFDLPGVCWWKRGLLGIHVHYYLWQIKAYFIADQLHRNLRFDITHHITYVRYSSPSFLALLPVPFIWGPVGGGESVPTLFWQDLSGRGKVYEVARAWVRWIGERDPFVRMTADRSCIAYATTPDTADRLKQIGCSNVNILSQVGFSPADMNHLAQTSQFDQRSIRFISTGRLLHWKGFHLGLQAFAQAGLSPQVEYWIVGQGAEETRLRDLAVQLGIAPQVSFLPEMPRPQLLATLGTCMALIHPSLHESGGFVCLEAMAIGCPVICLDLGGPAVQLTSEAGIKVPANSPKQAIADMAAALVRLVNEPGLRSQLGQAGQRHVQQTYLWPVKAAALSQVYREHARAFDG